jgi:hypothetical protein
MTIYESTQAWLETLPIDAETQLLADLCLQLAAKIDDKNETSAIQQLHMLHRRLTDIFSVKEGHDPLADLLRR